jgi:hypothetical protein
MKNQKRKTIILLIAHIFIFQSFSATKERIITGVVADSNNGEVLIGATLFEKHTGKGTATDNQGHYTLWVSAVCDSVEIEASYMGYELQTKKPTCSETTINWTLEPSSFNLNEVVVSSNTRKAIDPNLSSFKINKQELDALPGFAGEKDLLKYLQLTPGVQLTGDGNSNLYVRGGSSDQNLFLLDDMPLYHVSHLGNLTSTFNADIIKSADMYLGAFPAEYGGRLSSVVDVRTKDGDLYNHHQSVTLGMLTSKLMLEGPLLKGKAAYVASFRINTLPFFKMFWDMNIGFSMYDANIKLNYILSPNDRIYFSFYTGDDAMTYDLTGDNDSFSSDLKTAWGNTATSLRFNHIFTPRFTTNFIAGHSMYHYAENSNLQILDKLNTSEDKYSSRFTSNIADNFLVLKANYSISNSIKILMGYDFYYHTYQPGHNIIKQSGTNLNTINADLGYPQSDAFDHSFFTELIVDDLAGFSLNAGVRQNIFQSKKAVFTDFQPRIVLSRKITDELAVKASYARVWQPFHLLSNSSAGVPADYRIPAMVDAPPANSNQATVGLSYIPDYSDYEFTAETYYKLMANLADLKEGVSFTTNYSDWKNILAVNGRGESKGIELLARKVKGKSTGWIGATLAKSTRRFDDLNGGKVYPYKYDRTFDLGCFFQQQLTKKLSFSATWVFGTGLPYNIPRSQYEDIDGNYVLVYGELNQFRQKSYHRLDVGLSYKIQNRKSVGIIDFSIINLYNRRNPYIYITQSGNEGASLYEFSLFPIMPSLSYNLKF